MTISNGGPVFPFSVSIENHDGTTCTAHEAGMTLRDYFAAKAMSIKYGVVGSSIGIDDMAHNCYEMADAMLKQRTKT